MGSRGGGGDVSMNPWEDGEEEIYLREERSRALILEHRGKGVAAHASARAPVAVAGPASAAGDAMFPASDKLRTRVASSSLGNQRPRSVERGAWNVGTQVQKKEEQREQQQDQRQRRRRHHLHHQQQEQQRQEDQRTPIRRSSTLMPPSVSDENIDGSFGLLKASLFLAMRYASNNGMQA